MARLAGQKILITGGGGFIGSHLANALCKKNTVVAYGRSQHGVPLDSRVTFVTGDVTKPAVLSFIKKGSFDYIFHLAGNADQKKALDNPAADMAANFLSTFNMLDTIRTMPKQPRFILAASVTVYGDAPDRSLSEDFTVPQPISNYGASKLAADRYLYAFVRQYGMPALTIRFFSTYGPGMGRMMIYDFIQKLKREPDSLSVLGTGKEARDLTFIDDQIKTIITIAEKARFGGEVYNAGSGRVYTTARVAGAVARAMRLTPTITFTSARRVFDGKSWLASIKKINALGCRPTTPLEQGIKKTVAWFTKNV